MKISKTIALCLGVFLVGCKMTPEIPEYTTTRFNIPIQLSEFNSVAGHYVEKTAFVSLTTYANNEYPELLMVEADGYGSSYNEYTGVTKNKVFVRFTKNEAQVTVDAVNKYLEWQEQAMKAGDMFTKEIAATAKYDAGYGTATYNKFKFHSGNATNHYLVYEFCSSASLVGEQCTEKAALTKENAVKLKDIAERYLQGELKKEDVAAKYN